MNTAPPSSLRPAGRLLVNGIVAATSTVVRASMRGDWIHALATAERRRELLATLETEGRGVDASSIRALQQAVCESEHALAVIGAERWQTSRT
jgi:hypothetical protein